jgi:hypothetical protein
MCGGTFRTRKCEGPEGTLVGGKSRMNSLLSQRVSGEEDGLTSPGGCVGGSRDVWPSQLQCRMR